MGGRKCFIIVSFEGPDWYAWRGGLADRVTRLATTLAGSGFETHHYFFGDPRLPAEEDTADGPLVRHRWGQWLSAGYPGGAYDGEEAKVADLTHSLPGALLETVIRPALRRGSSPVILAEEWQTSWFVCALHDLLRAARLRNRVTLFWRTGSAFGIDRVDWNRLSESARLMATTPAVGEEFERRGISMELLDTDPASFIALADACAPASQPWRRAPAAETVQALQPTKELATDDR